VKRLARFVLRGGRRRPGPAGALQSRPKLLLFDFDGTIADTFENGLEILNLLAAECGFRPLDRSELPQARDMRTRELMKFLHIPTRKMGLISRRGKEELSKRIDAIQPLPGMCDIVRLLKNDGYLLGILTSNSCENVRAFLRNHDLDVFDFVRSSSKLLGKGREVRAILKERGFHASEILLIGDETRDVEAAREAGAHIAAVTWGYNSRRSLEILAPDYLFDAPDDLMALLSGLR
jgi:phosphoglycolate phosphatase-like HAD superfamily hydrolase